MGLRPLYIFVTSFSAGIDFIRQNPTSKVGLRAGRINVIIASKAVSSLYVCPSSLRIIKRNDH